ncbi:hypothetical protein BDQ17DRAFT_1416567 [Cyathus striatus]|nr:hypothetical protein BDQ17DRAFT_1416567 [Cyathus striatus]
MPPSYPDSTPGIMSLPRLRRFFFDVGCVELWNELCGFWFLLRWVLLGVGIALLGGWEEHEGVYALGWETIGYSLSYFMVGRRTQDSFVEDVQPGAYLTANTHYNAMVHRS